MFDFISGGNVFFVLLQAVKVVSGLLCVARCGEDGALVVLHDLQPMLEHRPRDLPAFPA